MTLAVRSMKPLGPLRRAIKRAIDFDHYVITLTPTDKVERPGGVYETVDVIDRLPQKFQLEAYNVYGYNTQADIGIGGNLRRYYQLTGTYDAIIEIGDHWADGDNTYRVVSILPENGYEKRALVESFGSEPNYG